MPSLKTLAVLLTLAACARPSQPAPLSPGPAPSSPGPGEQPEASADPAPQAGSAAPCTAGQEWFTPGPGADPLPANGCYTRCEAACPSGQMCRTVSTNPCGPTEDGQVKSCMAVSQQSRVCLPG